MNDKQQQLLFDKGITNVPSDAICSDNALSECVGLTYENGEHRVIQKPKVLVGFSGTHDLLYVHQFNNDTRYIILVVTSVGQGTYSYALHWLNENGATPSSPADPAITALSSGENVKVTSIGKTLIVSDSSSTRYFLWNTEGYESLGSSFPRPEMEFRLVGRSTVNKTDSQRTIGTLSWYDQAWSIGEGEQDEWNNVVIGLYSKLKKEIAREKAFHGSFCVRAALELYDGSYYHIENPVFMLNQFSAYGMSRIKTNDVTLARDVTVKMRIHGQLLQYRFKKDYSKWADIVKNVVIFVTKESYVFDSTIDAICAKGTDVDEHKEIFTCYFMTGSSSGSVIGHSSLYVGDDDPSDDGDLYQVFPLYSDDNLLKTIEDGVYYKLCDVGLRGNAANDSTWHNSSDHFDTHTIENITTQPQLGEDDYFSHCYLRAETLYSYNSRLNLANVSRSFFEGFDNFMPFDDSTESGYTFHVTIRTDEGDKVVEHTATTAQYQGIYFYYPDPRAIHVKIWKGNAKILDEDLKEHPALHGAYFFAGIADDMTEPTGSSDTIPSVSTSYEVLPNYVIQSEVNNPFVFKAAGYFKVGTGKILGMSSITQALSEGQFGQYPLLVFSDKGIWALSVASTGYYDSIHPISREVCNNPTSITQTDGAVYFTSAKGLMVVVGSQVKCVSEQMSGRTSTMKVGNTELVSDLGHFCDYLKTCFIAYDYRDSLLWIFKGSGLRYCYIYSIKSGTFSKFDFGSGTTVKNTVSNYPDYLIQVGTYVYTLNGRDNINLDPSSYSGSFITRPMKLENAMVPKTIMDIRNIKTFTPYSVTTTVNNESVTTTTTGTLSLAVYGSNNLFNWVQLKSLRGLPWKYYRFKYTFSGLKAVDRFAGCVVRMQERRRLTK